MSFTDLRPVLTAGDLVTPATSLLRVLDDIRGTDELVEVPVPPELLLTRLLRFIRRQKHHARALEPLLCCLHLGCDCPTLHWYDSGDPESESPARPLVLRREQAIKYLFEGRALS
jgi:hypothetical protein